MVVMNELKSIRSADLKIGNLTIKAHVLNNGKRIIEEQSVIDFFYALENESLLPEEVKKFAKEFKEF